MSDSRNLKLLWTNADPITAEKMVLMYTTNSMIHNWWDKVTVIIWGSTAKLVAENKLIQEKIKMAQHVGVHFSACKACAQQLDVADKIEELGIEVIYWGQGLTDALQGDDQVLTV